MNLLKSLDFQQLSHSQHFGLRVSIYQIVLKRVMVILADIFAVLLQYFRVLVGGNLITTKLTGSLIRARHVGGKNFPLAAGKTPISCSKGLN